jgi:enediyne biosynthesis thioesterase
MFGNVYFSNYIEYQGSIREKFLLSTVPNLHEILSETGIRLVTVDTYNKFISNSYFGDTLLVELTTSDINASTCRLDIRFKNKTSGKLVGQGYQRFCVVNSRGRVIRIPDVLLHPLDFYQEIEH